MWRFILLSFALMGWRFYELSGGSDFQPVSKYNANSPVLVETLPAAAMAEPSKPVQSVAVVAQSAAAARPLANAAPEAVTLASASAEPVRTRTSLDLVRVRPMPQPAANPKETVAVVIATEPEPIRDLRQVKASSVNMRSGPGTSFDILARLTRGTEVEILQDPGSGWVKLRVAHSGRVGWMSASLLTRVE
jgi:uncharacterized protein YgiM (DUF1202 family)